MNRKMMLFIVLGYAVSRLEAMELKAPYAPSKFNLSYDKRILQWYAEEKTALKKCKERAKVEQDDDERRVRHCYPFAIEQLYLSYALKANGDNKYSKTDLRYYWPGSINFKGKKLYGFFESTIGSDRYGAPVVYHRCFKSPTKTALEKYPDNVVNASANARYNWSEYIARYYDKTDEDFVCDYRTNKKSVAAHFADKKDIIKESCFIEEILTNCDDYVIPHVTIDDPQDSNVSYELYTAYIKKDGSADTADYNNLA